jgi:hypothetical protein
MAPSDRFLVLFLLVGVACSPAAPAAPGPAAEPTGAPAEEIAEAITPGYPVSLPSLDPHPVVAQTGAFAFDPNLRPTRAL